MLLDASSCCLPLCSWPIPRVFCRKLDFRELVSFSIPIAYIVDLWSCVNFSPPFHLRFNPLHRALSYISFSVSYAFHLSVTIQFTVWLGSTLFPSNSDSFPRLCPAFPPRLHSLMSSGARSSNSPRLSLTSRRYLRRFAKVSSLPEVGSNCQHGK